MNSSGRHLRAALISILLALLVGAPAQAKAPSGPIPNAYIGDYATRGVDCPGWHVKRGKKLVHWQTYAAGSVSSSWATVASRGKLCATARSAGKRNVRLTRAGWPDDPFPIEKAVAHQGREYLAPGSPAGWRCYVLPSQWELHAAQLATQAGESLNQGSGAFAAAQGFVNAFGYCVSARAARDAVGGDGKWHGGEFIAWGPGIARCDLRLALRGEEQKDGSTIFPPFYRVQADAVFYYNTARC